MSRYDTVTGRTYTSTRPRGFAPWNPKPETQMLLQQVAGILNEYRSQLPLTNRQIFYRLVGTIGYEKTERGYARLCENLTRARRAGLIPFRAIRDDGTTAMGGGGYDGPDDYYESLSDSVDRYRHDPTDGQAYHLEVWVEASGMVPQAAQVAHRYGITTYSAGGFNGLTDKYETAERLSQVERPCVVLHLGDHDPSGCAIIDSLADDINAFLDGMGTVSGEDVNWERVAVTPDQIEQYDLPTAPQKRTDKRGEQMDETVQAEALPPDTLADELRQAIERYIDLDQLQAIREQSNEERDEIRIALESLIGNR